MQPKIHDLALGKWLDILPGIGIDRKFLRNTQGPCPICGGKDRYRWDNKGGGGGFYCNHCGAGNGIDLVMKFKGWDFITARSEIEKLLPSASIHIPKAYRDGDAQSRMISIWQQASPIRDGDVVSRWLMRRGISLTKAPTQLRFSVNAPYTHDGGLKTYHPAMLAKWVSPDLSEIIVHRTYLTDDGAKAEVPSVRKMSAGKIPKGGAVRLASSGETLGVAEGIETSLAASQLFKVPVWSCLTAGLLQNFEPPKTVRRIVIFGDNDASYAGQAAAYGLAYKLKPNYEVEVRIPDNTGTDFNDLLCDDLGIPRPAVHKHKEMVRDQPPDDDNISF